MNNIENKPIYLLAPLSRLGLMFAEYFIKNNNVIAVIDDKSLLDTIFNRPRWSSEDFLKKSKNYTSAIAVDFSTSGLTKTWAENLCRTAGIQRIAYDATKNGDLSKPYASITPVANYAPWMRDIDFNFIFNKIAESTLVDHFRLWELWELVEQTNYIPGDILEVGVWRGGTAALMAWKVQQQNNPCSVYLCDTFTGVVKAGAFDSCYYGGEHSDTSREYVENLMMKFVPDTNIHILEGVFPDQTGLEIKDKKFRLVHIDVDTYQSAQDIFNYIWPNISSGGIIVYDDYGFEFCSGITKHVNDLKSRSDTLVIHNLNGHALVIKKDVAA